MFQSYKTNRCCLAALALLLLLNSLWAPKVKARQAPHPEWQQFIKYERKFTVPENKKDALWDFLLTNFRNANAKIAFETQENFTSCQFFDTPNQDLLRHEAAIFQVIAFEKEGRKKHVEFWQKHPEGWQITRFRNNKKPEKGRDFTNNPLVKLLQTKDRPGLDSLLQRWHLKWQELEPVFETTQHRRLLLLRRNGSDWVRIVLQEVRTEVPAVHWLEVSISPDLKVYAQATPPQRRQLQNFTNALAAQLQQKFPDLKPDNRSLYAKMADLQQTQPQGLARPEMLLALLLIAGIVVFFLLRKPWNN